MSESRLQSLECRVHPLAVGSESKVMDYDSNTA